MNDVRMTHIKWRRAFKQMDREWQRVAILMFVLGIAVGATITLLITSIQGG